ncbi:MAG: hypothetical protein O3C21_08425 [Verrucomicrobia bacterium]|nr:hypothetical protein [Verrucomicrobiota bacterium]
MDTLRNRTAATFRCMQSFSKTKLMSLAAAVLVSGGGYLVGTESAPAQELTETERTAILTEIEKIEKTLEDGRSKNNVRALGKLREAVASPAASLNFYLECLKAKEWDEKGKRESEWREWRDGQDDFKDSGYAKARQYQIRYLILSIQAGMLEENEDAARGKMISALAGFLKGLVDNYRDVVNHSDVLRESALGGVMATQTRVDVTLEKPKNWAQSPLAVDSIYESTIQPFYREQRNGASLRNAWESRISQLSAIKGTAEPVKISTRANGGVLGSYRRGGGTPDRDEVRDERKDKQEEAEARLAEFKKDDLPDLEWEMERDTFVFGSNRAASARTLGSHIRGHLDHPSANSWIEELKKLASGDFNIEDYISPSEPDLGKPKAKEGQAE